MSGIPGVGGELIRLTEGYCDGTLNRDELVYLERRLLDDPAARLLFRKYLALDTALREYGDSAAAHWDSVGERPPSVRGTSKEPQVVRSWRKSLWTASGICAIALAGLTVLLIVMGLEGRHADAASLGLLDEVTGDVRVFEPNGTARRVAPDTLIRSGDTVRTVGEQSSTVFAYPDGTRLTFVGNTSVTCGDHRFKNLVVHRGTIAATVQPQPKENPLILTTPLAQVQVLGTSFLMESFANRTDVTVTEGLVRMVRVSDGEAIDVPQGKFAVVTEQTPLNVQDPPTLRVTCDWDFEHGLPEGWCTGEWTTEKLPAGAHGVVKPERFKSEDGQWYEGIRSYEAWMQGLFEVLPDSHLHMKLKMDRPNWINIFVNTRTKEPTQPSFSGNYLFNELPRITPGEWQTITIPLSEFRRLHAGDIPLSNLLPFKLSLIYSGEGRGLVIDRIWVTPNGPGRIEVQGQE